MFGWLRTLFLTRLRWQPQQVRWVFWSLLVLWAVLWYVAFEELITSDREGNEALRHVGLAFGLAGFFGLTVDYYVKRQLIEEIVQETGPYIFTHGTPEELREVVMRAREVTLVRRDLLLELAFREHGDYVELETTISYSLENCSAVEQPHTHGALVADDKHPNVMPCGITLLQARGSDIVGGGYVLRGSDVPVQYGTKPGQPAAHAAKDIRIKPNVGRVRNDLTARTTAILEKQDEELYFTQIPIIGLTVRVIDKPKQLKVRKVLVSHAPGEITGEPIDDPIVWNSSAGLLAWSAVAIAWRWDPAPPPVVQPSSPSPKN